MTGAVELAHCKVVVEANLFDVEVELHVGTAPHGDTVVVAQGPVDVADLFHRREVHLQVVPEALLVGGVAEQHGIRFLPVPPRAARLLEIRLQRFGSVHVHHEAHVGLVDTHAESIGGHHHLTPSGHPELLAMVALARVEPGVIICRRHSRLLQEPDHMLRAAAAAHVDDACPPYPPHYSQQAAELVAVVQNHVCQVFAHETRLEPAAVVHQQFRTDILGHPWRSRCREGNDRCCGVILAYVGNLKIRRTEIVAPLRNAVRLVHGNHAHLHVPEMLYELPLPQAFGRHIEKLQRPADSVGQHVRHLFTLHARHNARGLELAVVQLLHLVFHEGYQRRHHQAHPLAHQRWQLVAERLAATSRKQGQRVVALHHGFYDFLLQGAERIVAPMLFQKFVFLVHQRIIVTVPCTELSVVVPGLRNRQVYT